MFCPPPGDGPRHGIYRCTMPPRSSPPQVPLPRYLLPTAAPVIYRSASDAIAPDGRQTRSRTVFTFKMMLDAATRFYVSIYYRRTLTHALIYTLCAYSLALISRHFCS